MLLKRKRPSGLETSVTRGQYLLHLPIDNSVEFLDSEDLPYGCGNWEGGLRSGMRSETFEWLARHHPELTFDWQKNKPKGADFMEVRGNGWITATRRSK